MSAKPGNDEGFSYDSVADRYAREVDSAPYNALYERPAMLAMIDQLPGGVRNRRVLDAGCGAGWYAAQLLERGAQVAGIDESRRMLGYARTRFNESQSARDLPVLAAVDLSSGLPFHSASFDFVISPLVLHYMKDWRPALHELARVLVPGGRLVFSTHHPGTEAQRLIEAGFPVRYGEVQAVEEEWEVAGRVRFYRRPLSRIVEDLADATFVVERLVEPVPTDAFRDAKPESYAELLERPAFLIVQARTRS